VKAFNTIGAEAYLHPRIGDHPLFLPIAGDIEPAEAVRRLATDIGFDAVVIGDGSAARILENFAELWIHLAFRTGLGRGFGFARLTR
jgi:8-hydroxy-5-deazaflavin:NADPH oxidoreductase